MAKPVVAVDVDDVLIPHGDVLVEHLSSRIGTEVKVNSFYSLDELMEWFGRSREELQAMIHQFLESDEFAAIGPIQEAVAALERLKPQYQLMVVTARPGITQSMTKEWLQKHFPATFTDVHFANLDYVWGSVSNVSKQNICQIIGAEYLIDDSLRHIQEVSECGIKGILYGEYAWNKTEELPDNVVRAKNWDEVLKILL